MKTFIVRSQSNSAGGIFYAVIRAESAEEAVLAKAKAQPNSTVTGVTRPLLENDLTPEGRYVGVPMHKVSVTLKTVVERHVEIGGRE